MSERYYSEAHIWVNGEEGILTFGITDHAQEKLGDVMFVNLPDAGDTVEAGKRFGDIESIKTVSDLIAPASGEVTEVNTALEDEPELLNEDPYSNWLIRIKADGLPGGLMSEEEYLSRKDEL
ncbi:MAG: glycine cleavage system protein GcvH [Lachnospiraceae bacterium]|nr:glycine cleavage system protein GcvH [Lachnospiraceae bacterium]